MDILVEKFTQYVQNNKDLLIQNWMGKVIISKEDLYKDKIQNNGFSMLHFVCLFARNEINEEMIQNFARKIAVERLEANINIGEFVYNINLGRSEIFNFLHELADSIHELRPLISKINQAFDLFLYHAVSYYTDLKDRHLEEKNCFIEQTHKDRLTILGQMSSSFVHEFRNPLTSVIGFITLLKQLHPNLEYVDIISSELDQLKFRISQFLMASKKEILENNQEKINLSQLFKETLDFLYPVILSSEVHVEMDVHTDLTMTGYREELRQVLINLILNSIDALENASVAKTIYIQVRNTHDDHIIKIANNGPSIPAHLMETIFEPFVTTKKLGTGIGLYICRKIIEKHQGFITCTSCNDITEFIIQIPNKKNEV